MREKKKKSWSIVVVFMLLVAGGMGLFFHAMHKKDLLCLHLVSKLGELEALKLASLEEKEDLLLQIGSRSDKDWIEMVLKKRLGVVPEGQMKVYFRKNEP